MRQIAFLILFVSSALAADKTAYVRTDCANNGDGTASSCAGSPGGAGAYKTCGQAITGEVAANANLVTMAGDLIIDAAGTTAETAECTISGFTTSATYLVRLRGDWPGGTWSTAHYRFDYVRSNLGHVDVRDEYVEIDRLQSNNAGTGSGAYYGVYVGEGLGGLSVVVTNSIFTGASSSGTSGGIYFRPNVANARGTFINNIVYGYAGTSSFGLQLDGSGYNNGEIIIAYNNLSHGANRGIVTHGGGSSDALYLKNNATQGNATAGYAIGVNGAHTTNTSATNLSEDTSSPNDTLDSLAIAFVGEGSDFHLASGDTAAKDAGTDLSGDAQYPFSTDTDGATRSGTWDIGPDEITTVAAKALSVLNAMGEL